MKIVNGHVIRFLATVGWIGYAPVAPGTFGSLAALPLCLLISRLSEIVAVLVVLSLIAASIWIAHAAERVEGQGDPKQVVVDEVCGMAVTLLGLPFTPAVAIGGLAIFRLFDILKPFPIGWVDKRLSGGWGIMLDDILAGICANMVLRVVLGLT